MAANNGNTKRPLILAIGLSILILTVVIGIIIYLFSVKTCTKDCTGKVCGSDGCGGSCGKCSTGEVCDYNHACCLPSCAGKQCGDDLCGGTCGQCDSCNQSGICTCNADYMADKGCCGHPDIPAGTKMLRCPKDYPTCTGYTPTTNPVTLGTCSKST